MDKIQFAHNLRGIAALSVVLGHLALMFFVSPDTITGLVNVPSYPVSHPFWVILFAYIPDFVPGPFGVSVFFLISGFVIPFSLQKYSRLQFMLARLMRIVPTYAVGCFISCLAIYYAVIHYGTQFPYTIKQVLVNMFLIRDLFGGPSLDGVIWTLEVELKYYFFCMAFSTYFKRQDYKSILLFLVGVLAFFLFFVAFYAFLFTLVKLNSLIK